MALEAARVEAFAFKRAKFGGALSCAPAPLVFPSPASGCGEVQNEHEVKGRVAIVPRGGCFFADKVRIMQEAQAVGVIVVNTPGSPLVAMPAGDLPVHDLSIPAVMVPHAAGAALERAVKRQHQRAQAQAHAQARESAGDGQHTLLASVQPRQAAPCSVNTLGGCCPAPVLPAP